MGGDHSFGYVQKTFLKTNIRTLKCAYQGVRNVVLNVWRK